MILAEHTAWDELLEFIQGVWVIVQNGGPLVWAILVGVFVIFVLVYWPKRRKDS